MDVLIGAFFGVVIGLAVLLVLGFVLQWLWNTTLPDIMGVKQITTVQAIKLLFLASILFGGHRVVTVPADPVEVDAVTEAPATTSP